MGTIPSVVTMTSNMFLHYEKELFVHKQTAEEGLEKLKTLDAGAQRTSTLDATSKAIDVVAETLAQMELEARSSAGDTKAQQTAQARQHKEALGVLRKRLSDANQGPGIAAQRAQLLAGSDQAMRMVSDEQHSRLLATPDRLNKGNQKLQQAMATALETEQIGESIMVDLESQRQTIERSRATLHSANSGLARSKKLLRSMGKRALANRLLMIVIIGLLVLSIFFILYLQFFYSPTSPAPAPALVTTPPPSPPPPSPPPPMDIWSFG